MVISIAIAAEQVGEAGPPLNTSTHPLTLASALGAGSAISPMGPILQVKLGQHLSTRALC